MLLCQSQTITIARGASTCRQVGRWPAGLLSFVKLDQQFAQTSLVLKIAGQSSWLTGSALLNPVEIALRWTQAGGLSSRLARSSSIRSGEDTSRLHELTHYVLLLQADLALALFLFLSRDS